MRRMLFVMVEASDGLRVDRREGRTGTVVVERGLAFLEC